MVFLLGISRWRGWEIHVRLWQRMNVEEELIQNRRRNLCYHWEYNRCFGSGNVNISAAEIVLFHFRFSTWTTPRKKSNLRGITRYWPPLGGWRVGFSLEAPWSSAMGEEFAMAEGFFNHFIIKNSFVAVALRKYYTGTNLINKIVSDFVPVK